MDTTRIVVVGDFKYIDGSLFVNRKTKGWVEVKGSITAGNRRYRNVGMRNKKGTYSILAHRKIWEMFNRPIPRGMFIDHINNDPLDNRIENLRLVTPQQNNLNINNRVYSSHGVRGVSRCFGKWRAYINLNRRKFHLGVFDTLEEATQARRNAEPLYGYR